MRTLFVSDLDGTLLNTAGKLSENTVSLLRPRIENGLLFSVATARSPATTAALLAPLHLTVPAVLLSGSMLYRFYDQKIVRTFPFAPEPAGEICFLLDQLMQEAVAYCVKDGRFEIYYKETGLAFDHSFVIAHMRESRKRFQPIACYREALLNAEALLFVMALPDARSARDAYTLFSAVPNSVCSLYRYRYGGGWLLHISPAGIDKAYGVAALRALLGIEQTVAFGDGFHDAAMLRAADASCAMARSCAEVRESALHRIGSCDDDSVARWIAAHEKEFL